MTLEVTLGATPLSIAMHFIYLSNRTRSNIRAARRDQDEESTGEKEVFE